MEYLECDNIEEIKNQILTNLDRLPNLKIILDENFINDTLLKIQKAKNQEELNHIPKLKDIEPNSIIWLIKNYYQLLYHFDRGLGYIKDESLRKYVISKIKNLSIFFLLFIFRLFIYNVYVRVKKEVFLIHHSQYL